MKKTSHGYLTKQFMYSFKANVNTSPHVNHKRTFQLSNVKCDTPMKEFDVYVRIWHLYVR